MIIYEDGEMYNVPSQWLAEHDKQIKDKAYHQGMLDERKRIIKELEENAYQETQDNTNPYPSPMVVTLNKAVEIVKGDKQDD